MKVLQINTTVNTGSTGRIAENIGKLLIERGHSSYIAYGRSNRSSKSELIKIGNTFDQAFHVLLSRLFDRHGFGSRLATKRFIKNIDKIKPDLIHFHNLHGYYLNIKELSNYLTGRDIPIVWTFHDCWPFTGHCSFFISVKCTKWEHGCYSCPSTRKYPASLIIDNSKKNYLQKLTLFTSLGDVVCISPSNWLANHLQKSFLNKYQVKVINNGIDLDVFRPIDAEIAREKYGLKGKSLLLGVANIWDNRKGLSEFIKLRSRLDADTDILLVGLNKKQIEELPDGIKGILRTDSIEDLVALYSAATVFVNPTHTDNFPTTNLESLACGTPVVTYNTGGSPEAIDMNTGRVVEAGDIDGLVQAIDELHGNRKTHYIPVCRKRAETLFDNEKRYMDYIMLYDELLGAK